MEMRDLKTCYSEKTKAMGIIGAKTFNSTLNARWIIFRRVEKKKKKEKKNKKKKTNEWEVKQRNYNQLIVTDLNKFIINI